ncbi:AIPR family protein [Flavobacterium sp. RHBU_24]|uniref:AIPR family protein n=1 Tax=Flavobacterium sp. RHBU_24 TaxID=3391185 RepID=UPI00398518B1
MNSSKLTILSEVLKQKKIDIAPEMDDDEFFNLFSSEQILKDFDLSYEELIDGVVEGGNDGGIDSLYTFINGELLEEDTDYTGLKKEIVVDLVFIQSKNTKGFSEEAINKFIASAKDLLNLSIDLSGLKATYKKELIKKVSLFRRAYLRLASKFPTLNITYYYSALADLPHPNVTRKIPHLKSEINSYISDCNFLFNFIGVNELLTLARKTPIRVKALNIEGTPINTKDGGYIALVSLPNYYHFITENDKLMKAFFDANVRDYQGRIEVNQAISDTLRNPNNEDFWWLNNGVTITTTNTTLASQALMIEDPQIVNGLQSSHEIFNHFSSGGTIDDSRKIMIRVIKPSDEKSRLKIIKATNSQTNVPIASLRATDEIHLNIEDYFLSAGYYYDRRKNYYKNIGKPAESIISIPYLSQIITATVLKEPNNSRARPSTLIKNDEEYLRIFNREYDVDIYLQSFKIQKKVESALKAYRPELTTSAIGDLKFHVTTFTVVEYLKKITYNPTEIKNINVDRMPPEQLNTNITVVNEIYQSLGGTNKVAKSQNFIQTIFAKLGEIIAQHKEALKQESIANKII